MEVSEETYRQLKAAAEMLVEETRWECGGYIQELASNVSQLVEKIGKENE